LNVSKYHVFHSDLFLISAFVVDRLCTRRISNCISGRNAEFAIKRMLQTKSFYIIRNADSQTSVDLIATNGKVRVIVQIKRGHIY
jgi:hypothetical protein